MLAFLSDVVLKHVLEGAFAFENDLLLDRDDLSSLEHLISLHFLFAMSFADFILCVLVLLSILNVIEKIVPTGGLILKLDVGSFVPEVWVCLSELGHLLLDLIELLSFGAVGLDSDVQIFFEFKFHDGFFLRIQDVEMCMSWGLSLVDELVSAGLLRLTSLEADIEVS